MTTRYQTSAIKDEKVRKAFLVMGQLTTPQVEELMRIVRRTWPWVDWDQRG